MDQLSEGNGAERLTPQELFTRCEENARTADREAYEGVLSLIAGELTFRTPLFEADPLLDAAPSPDDSEDLKIQKAIHHGERYREILKLLKEHRSRDARLVLVALWLKQEGICEPIELLPKALYQRLTREKQQGLKISISDQQHYHQVEAWRPYFERLFAERRKKEKAKENVKDGLVKAGYEEQAIIVSQKRRTVIPAICEARLSPRNRRIDTQECSLPCLQKDKNHKTFMTVL
jgi:hypothetical protein